MIFVDIRGQQFCPPNTNPLFPLFPAGSRLSFVIGSLYKYSPNLWISFPSNPSAKMRQILTIILVLSILGINHVTAQNNNWLAGLALGGVAGWAAGSYINRMRRQDALNDFLLYRSIAPRPYWGWGSPYYGGRGFCKSLSLFLSINQSINRSIKLLLYMPMLLSVDILKIYYLRK